MQAATTDGAYGRLARSSFAILLASLSSVCAAKATTTLGSEAYQRAAVLARDGKEAESANLLQRLVSTPDGRLARRARILLMSDERALFQYRAALEAIEPLLKAPDAELENRARLLGSLIDVPPETFENRAPISLQSATVDATIGKKKFEALMDTGASFSVLARSSAIQAGLRIRPVHYQIESALGRKLYADAAIGDVAIAGTRLHNIVFLVLPDEALRRGLPCPAIIGLPVLRLLGPLNFGGSGETSSQTSAPLMLVRSGTAVVITAQRTRLRCLLDTGSNRSWVTNSPGARLRGLQDGRRALVIENAAGGTRGISGYEIPLALSLAGRSAVLNRALVMTSAERVGNIWSCSLGMDAIAALAPISLDFGRMRIVLR